MMKLTIVKVGGAVLEDPESFAEFLHRFHSIEGYKMLVHGGGRTATQIAGQLGIETKMADGRRITDRAMLEVVTMVYGGLINKNSVAFLQSIGCNALGITGADLDIIRAKKRLVTDIDFGWVGDITRVNGETLQKILLQDIVPVIAPLTHDGAGNLLNTNADTIASAIASALSACFMVTLIYCFEKDGVLSDPNDNNSVIPLLNIALYEKYRSENIIHSGMIPKLDNCFRALESGVNEVWITNQKMDSHNQGTKLKL
ncbi:MAG: acetylglutamate kinase [Bacteroidales bacterium]|nr:acetylglutamate kinase [Bacteroidales bacterium]